MHKLYAFLVLSIIIVLKRRSRIKTITNLSSIFNFYVFVLVTHVLSISCIPVGNKVAAKPDINYLALSLYMLACKHKNSVVLYARLIGHNWMYFAHRS